MSAADAPLRRRGRGWIALAAVVGASAVGLAAFGAHALRGRLAAAAFSPWDTAAHYQLVHAVALLGLGLYAEATGRSVRLPATLLCVGLALFCGGLYLLVATGWSGAGLLAPLGGMTLIAGWLALLALWR